MPLSPKDEIARRRQLRLDTDWGSSLYHGESRKPATGGNVPIEESDCPFRNAQPHLESVRILTKDGGKDIVRKKKQKR